jgi:hypothetical protein
MPDFKFLLKLFEILREMLRELRNYELIENERRPAHIGLINTLAIFIYVTKVLT